MYEFHAAFSISIPEHLTGYWTTAVPDIRNCNIYIHFSLPSVHYENHHHTFAIYLSVSLHILLDHLSLLPVLMRHLKYCPLTNSTRLTCYCNPNRENFLVVHRRDEAYLTSAERGGEEVVTAPMAQHSTLHWCLTSPQLMSEVDRSLQQLLASYDPAAARPKQPHPQG